MGDLAKKKPVRRRKLRTSNAPIPPPLTVFKHYYNTPPQPYQTHLRDVVEDRREQPIAKPEKPDTKDIKPDIKPEKPDVKPDVKIPLGDQKMVVSKEGIFTIPALAYVDSGKILLMKS